VDVEARMSARSLIRRPSAWLPLLMSIAALTMIAWYLALHGPVPQADEGLQARLWQLLMALQLPVIAYFAISWLPRAPRLAVAIIALQVAAALLLGLLPLALLGGL
jgi:hypothetical protein